MEEEEEYYYYEEDVEEPLPQQRVNTSKNYNNRMLQRPRDDLSIHSKRGRKQEFSEKEDTQTQSRRGKSSGTSRSVNEDTYLQRHLANRYEREASITDEERDGSSRRRKDDL